MQKSLFKTIKTLIQAKLRIMVIGALLLTGVVGFWGIRNYYTNNAPLSVAPEEIKGKVITLKQLNEDYYIDYHHMFSNTVRKSIEFPEVITLAYTIAYLRDEQQKMAEGAMVQYCIFDNKDKNLIGSIQIREKNNEDPGQFGVWINEKYWGNGRFQESVALISNIYFRLKPHATSYIAHVRLWNKRSYRALKKCGFVDVGYFYENGKASRYILEFRHR